MQTQQHFRPHLVAIATQCQPSHARLCRASLEPPSEVKVGLKDAGEETYPCAKTDSWNAVPRAEFVKAIQRHVIRRCYAKGVRRVFADRCEIEKTDMLT
jgi:hypothetical protein